MRVDPPGTFSELSPGSQEVSQQRGTSGEGVAGQVELGSVECEGTRRMEPQGSSQCKSTGSGVTKKAGVLPPSWAVTQKPTHAGLLAPLT